MAVELSFKFNTMIPWLILIKLQALKYNHNNAIGLMGNKKSKKL